ncbi:MAG TPA: glycosyltransferase, partial [Candidatus Omnitrophota bacterium]|nr:glycosyltransferase [Candidatus Omnitrophota bacterium]
NASRDGSCERARRTDPGFPVIVVENRRNEGFAKANNAAFARCDAPFIALLNADTKVERDWLAKLITKMQSDARIAVAGSRQVPQESSRKIDPITHEASWCSGGHCLIRAEALNAVGYFDEGFFMYGEDVDLCWRMWIAGYSCVHVPEAVCHHHYDGSERNRSRRLYYHVRNSILLRYCYGEAPDVKKEIGRWMREGLSRMIRHGAFGESWAVLAGVLGHYAHAGYFAKKGAVLKANARFNEVRRDWISI